MKVNLGQKQFPLFVVSALVDFSEHFSERNGFIVRVIMINNAIFLRLPGINVI